MSKRCRILAAGVSAPWPCWPSASLGGYADDPAGRGPVFSHGLEVRVRKAGETDFTDKTKKIGLEFFLDGANGNGVYIGDAGDLATVAAKLVGADAAKVMAPEWSHGMELQARKADEKVFTKDTKKYGVEVVATRTTATTSTCARRGAFDAVCRQDRHRRQDRQDVKAPDWKNGMVLRVRKAGEPDFNDKTQKIGVEIFLDPNNGNIVYISADRLDRRAAGQAGEDRRVGQGQAARLEARHGTGRPQGRREGVQQGHEALRRGGVLRRLRRRRALRQRDGGHRGRAGQPEWRCRRPAPR